MFVDPNTDVNTKVEHILIEAGTITLPNGKVIGEGELTTEETEFHRFCKSHDPNLCFISAYVITNDDEQIFYTARDIALQCGIHCQAGREKAEIMKKQWDQYLFAKKHEIPPNRSETEPPTSGENELNQDEMTNVNETMDAQTISIDTPKNGKVFG